MEKLPDGAFVSLDAAARDAWLVWGGNLLRWTHDGYDDPRPARAWAEERTHAKAKAKKGKKRSGGGGDDDDGGGSSGDGGDFSSAKDDDAVLRGGAAAGAGDALLLTPRGTVETLRAGFEPCPPHASARMTSHAS